MKTIEEEMKEIDEENRILTEKVKREYEFKGNFAGEKIYGKGNERVLYDPKIDRVTFTYKV